ncbi:MAG: extracellular solute-binding protein [Anaerolineae bacterium]|nr:extracellular solute-binding protein [Anaerolineae bacterium]
MFTSACSALQPQTATGGAKIIVAWHSLSGLRERVLLDLVDRWNRSNPDGTTIIPERRDAALIPALLNEANQKGQPALILSAPNQAAAYHQKGWVRPLDAFITDANSDIGWGALDRNDLYPFVFSAGQASDGATIGIPFAASARVVMYNRNWVRSTLNVTDTMPLDWPQFSALCGKIVSQLRGAACFGLDGSAITMDEWVNAHGGRVMTNAGQVNFPSASMVNGLDRMLGFLQTGQAYRSNDAQLLREDFVTERVPFMFDWSDRIEEYKLAVKQRSNFPLGIGLLPSAGSTFATPVQTSLWLIVKSPNLERDKYAWKFVKWLSSSEQTLRWAIPTGDLPLRTSVINHFSQLNDATLSQHQNDLVVAFWPRMGQAALASPAFVQAPCIRAAQSDSIRQILDGQPISPTIQGFQSGVVGCGRN